MNELRRKKETPRGQKPTGRWKDVATSGSNSILAPIRCNFKTVAAALPSRDTKERALLAAPPIQSARTVTNRGLRRPPTPRAVAGMRAEPHRNRPVLSLKAGRED